MGTFPQPASDLGLSPNTGQFEQYIPTTTHQRYPYYPPSLVSVSSAIQDVGMDQPPPSCAPNNVPRNTGPSESGSNAVVEEIPVLLTDRSIYPFYKPSASIRTRNLSNLVKIPISSSVEVRGSPTVFVPSVLLSNVMSIAPKIDEIREVLSNLNVDLGCFVETWLQEHIPDQIVAAAGYNLIRRDRCVGQHGGVCAYMRKTIKYHVLENLFDASF